VECIHVGEYATNCYLVENEAIRELLIVDPGAEAQRIIQAVADRKPVAVLATHGHYDHMGGVDRICAHFGIPFYLHAEDIPKLTDVAANGSRLFAQDMAVQIKAVPLADGQRLRLAGMDIVVLHTPGHSRGSCCFFLPEDQGVLCGDTLFHGGYGRTDIADGNFADLKKSLRKLLFRSPPVTAYPGHGPYTLAGSGRKAP
jgi:glyoxylase-like metal-dependent hydrolase (beta-lactamase superfamily II)